MRIRTGENVNIKLSISIPPSNDIFIAPVILISLGKYARVKLDDSDKQPGWKFAQWEMKGVPVRLEVGPRDIENGQCVLVRRDTREKQFVKFDELATAIPAAMDALAKDLYDRALENREKRTYSATTLSLIHISRFAGDLNGLGIPTAVFPARDYVLRPIESTGTERQSNSLVFLFLFLLESLNDNRHWLLCKVTKKNLPR